MRCVPWTARWTLAFALVTVVVLSAWLSPAWSDAPAKAPRQKWEYKFVKLSDLGTIADADYSAGLNKLGEEGWELAAIEHSKLGPERCVFKRPR